VTNSCVGKTLFYEELLSDASNRPKSLIDVLIDSHLSKCNIFLQTEFHGAFNSFPVFVESDN
jgi:hypothetical protein